MLRNKQIAMILIITAIIIGLEQFLVYGTFFEPADLPIHHELFMMMFSFTGATLLVLWYIRKNKWSQKK